MANPRRGVQFDIRTYFPPVTPEATLAEVTSAIDQDPALTEKERRLLSADMTKAIQKSTRKGKKHSNHTDKFINSVLAVHKTEGIEKALSFARKELKKELSPSTFYGWLSNSKIDPKNPDGPRTYVKKKRGRGVKMPANVEKWAKERLLFYLSKGARITRFLAQYVLVMLSSIV